MDTKVYCWTNEQTFTTPRFLYASGECELQDTLFLQRTEQGLSDTEAEELSMFDCFDETDTDET